jgi:hypothetical protein
MNKQLFPLLLLLSLFQTALAQRADTIYSRVILIGDAGEIDQQQSAVLRHAAGSILKGKTTVMYLGDNIYPKGMGLPGSKEEEQTKKILQSQYQPMRERGAPVYFIPGNHDWDKMGPDGLAKIKRQWEFLEAQKDSLLQLIPRNGCPDPVEIPVSPEVTIIAFDSEWWLFPYAKDNPEAECDCTSKDAILMRLQELLDKNRNKVILLASHHPFKTYGTHGGYYSLKDHLFPFTALNQNLYIPMPVVGSLYPFLRSTFPTPEDTGNPLYRDMVKRINQVFEGFPNVIRVAGHEHGLQFIKDKTIQVVSGAGAKNSYAVKGKHSLYANARQGYVIVDELSGKRMKFTYFIDTDTGVTQTFSYIQPYAGVTAQQIAQVRPLQGDSAITALKPGYDSVGHFHRFLFGENYRKEWAQETRLPVIRLSEIHGGLTPEKMGGGFQTKSLRLKDKNGKEYVLRGVEKSPEKILPEDMRETFAKDWVDDAMSAQHPFSALIVPPLAAAAGVPHANPIIGVVSADPNLGKYNSIFANKVCLLEEREPEGASDNTPKMIRNMVKDNDYNVDARAFLKARLLDLLIGDWDRHSDQWRWYGEKKGDDEIYAPVPRDRDQVFYTNQGVLPYLAARSWLAPNLQGFGGKIKDIRYSLWKSMFLDRYPAAQISHAEWTAIVEDFVKAETDEVLEAGLKRLPESAYKLRHDVLLQQLKDRRASIPAEMEKYYRFKNKIVDIHTTAKNELVHINGTPDKGMQVIINKVSKKGNIQDTLMNKTYSPDVTKEIRLYVGGGDDKIVLNNGTSTIKLRMVDSTGNKTVEVVQAKRKVLLYDRGTQLKLLGDSSRLRLKLSADSANTAYMTTNLMNVTMPLVTIDINPDDGFLLGAGFRRTHQEGFRKRPYNDVQEFFVSHSFSTKAFKIKYSGEWIKALGEADLLVKAAVNAPENSVNFYGRGNETVFDKTGDYKTFYRARFSTYEIDPALRWRSLAGMSISVGPSFQFYRYNAEDNTGRFISQPSKIGSYDSLIVDKDKLYTGLVANFTNDKRSNKILPVWGSYVNIKVQGYTGLNSYSKSFVQIIPEVALYKSFNTKGTIVLAERFGGGLTFGKTTFYQSLFLGGQGNLYGFRQNRFAGQHMVYNNLELRAKIGDFASYLVPGQIGLIGFYDIGRVWENGENSDQWHNGVGGGLYATASHYAIVKFIMGYSTEGWYPSINLGMRF